MKVLLALLNLTVLETVTGFTTFPAATTATTTTTTRTTELFASKLDGRAVDGEIKPLNNFLLVKTAKAIEETDGGILLTGKAKVEKTEGTVVSVGPGRTHPDSGTVFAMPVSESQLPSAGGARRLRTGILEAPYRNVKSLS